MALARRGDRRIHWERTGDGPAVLLVPGTGAGARQFGTLPRRFARAGLGCITMTPVGVPPSSPHAGAYDFEAAARDLLAVLDDAAAERCVPVGVSLGAKVALTACALAPDRLPRLVILAGSAVSSPRAEAVHRFFETAAAVLSAADLAAVLAPFLFGPTFFGRHPELVADVVRALHPDAAARALMVAQSAAARAFPGEALARSVRCPALCVAGAEDALTAPADVRATAALLPGGRYVEIADAGHALLLESRRTFSLICEEVAEEAKGA